VKKTYSNSQKGFSLVIALLLVVAFTSVLTSLVIGRKAETLRQAADIAGWEAAALGKAARVYVRNLMAADPNLVNILDIAGSGPTDIPIQTLIDLSLLPNDFGREINPGEFVNGLGQPMRVIMANYPIDGLPTDSATIPTAYIFFEDNQKSTAALMQDVVQAARRQGATISAPVFSGSTNISGNCNSLGERAIIWDTGCMSELEFEVLTGIAFAPGNFVLPAWRSVQFDSRAMMRYAQPENSGAQTMLVSLEMAEMKDCSDPAISANFAQMIKDDPSVVDGYEVTASNLCGAESDDVATLDDKRRDIIGIRNIEANNLLVDQQINEDIRTDSNGIAFAIAEPNPEFNLIGNLDITGDARTYEGDVAVIGDITADRNISVTGTGAGIAPSARIGDLNTGGLNVNNTITVSNDTTIAGNVNVSNQSEVQADTIANGSFTSNTMTMSDGSDLTINNNATFFGETTANSINASGNGGSYSAIIENASLTSLDIDSDTTVASAIEFRGATTMEDSSVLSASNGGTASCVGDFCPRREEQNICQQQTLQGYDECMEQLTRNEFNPAFGPSQ
jgi:hypothetical protein